MTAEYLSNEEKLALECETLEKAYAELRSRLEDLWRAAEVVAAHEGERGSLFLRETIRAAEETLRRHPGC